MVADDVEIEAAGAVFVFGIIDATVARIDAKGAQVFDEGVDDPVEGLAVVQDLQGQHLAIRVAAQAIAAGFPARLAQQVGRLAQVFPVGLAFATDGGGDDLIRQDSVGQIGGQRFQQRPFTLGGRSRRFQVAVFQKLSTRL